ncbi:hypothetical protein TNCV_1175491 [Trichonephila clavipes]|nr:hypothetical protein TNCV_1175491 [Trichonephila clavipes]
MLAPPRRVIAPPGGALYSLRNTGLDSDSRHVLIWRESACRYRSSNIVEKYLYDQSGLMVWTDIMADDHTELQGCKIGYLIGQ